MKIIFVFAFHFIIVNSLFSQFQSLTGLSTNTNLDTTWYRNHFNFDSEVGFTGQESLIQWFEAPADMKIKAFAFTCSRNDSTIGIEFQICKLNYSSEELRNMTDKRLGYYPGIGNGFNDITALSNYATGSWIPTSDSMIDPIKEIIWSNFENGITPNPSDNSNLIYQWIGLELSGHEPIVNKGDLVGIYLRNCGMILNEDLISFYSSENTGFNCLKFFQNNRIPEDNNSKGWWILNQTLDFIFIGERISTNAESDGNSFTDYFLFQNYPNPFNAETIISWQAPKSVNMTIKLYDVLGNEILNLFDGNSYPGKNEFRFNADGLASGVYYYKIQGNDFCNTKKLIILK